MRTFDYAIHMLMGLVTFTLGATLFYAGIKHPEMSSPDFMVIAALMMVLGMGIALATEYIDVQAEKAALREVVRRRMGLDK